MKKEESSHINWALEAKEGWVPYNMLLAYIKEFKKIVLHACDPNLRILEALCSLFQGHFGPKGTLTMGQCHHTFHVTYIVRASLICSICPKCRSPLSPRFYKMLGILEGMPPDHEYNQWTLLLDQVPYKFQNYTHWRKPLLWDSLEKQHGLCKDSGELLDYFAWMTKDKEVDL